MSGRRAVVAVVLTWAALAASDARAGWVKAASASGTSWANPTKASDLDPASYAADGVNKADWGNPLVLTFNCTNDVSRVRFSADRWATAVDKVEIKVFSTTGNVVQEFTATDGAEGYPNAAFKELAFSARPITKVEFRFHYVRSGYIFWAYEVQVFEDAPPIGKPTGTTLAPSSVSATSAVLRGRVDLDGGAACGAVFKYGLTADCTGGQVPVEGSFGSRQEICGRVPGLESNKTYYYRLELTNAATKDGPVKCGLESFVACPEESEDGALWVAPDRVGPETDAKWETPTAAFDDWDASAARCYHMIHDAELWSPYLFLDPKEPGLYTGLRFKAAKPDGFIDKIQIDIKTSAGWKPLYTPVYKDPADTVLEHNEGGIAGFEHNKLQELPFDLYPIKGCRVRFHMSTKDVGAYWALYELDFQQIGVNVVAANLPYYLEEKPGITLGYGPTVVDRIRIKADLSALVAGTFVIGTSGKVSIFQDANCITPLPFRQGSDYIFDLSSSKHRDALRGILGADLYVLGSEVSSAHRDSQVSCQLQYEGGTAQDRICYTVTKVHPVKLPTFLFANARYAPSIRFEIIPSLQAEVEVKIDGFAADIWYKGAADIWWLDTGLHRFQSKRIAGVGAGEALVTLDAARQQGLALYECYLSGMMCANAVLPNHKGAGQLEMKLYLVTGGHETTIPSLREEGEIPYFADKSIPAVDIPLASSDTGNWPRVRFGPESVINIVPDRRRCEAVANYNEYFLDFASRYEHDYHVTGTSVATDSGVPFWAFPQQPTYTHIEIDPITRHQDVDGGLIFEAVKLDNAKHLCRAEIVQRKDDIYNYEPRICAKNYGKREGAWLNISYGGKNKDTHKELEKILDPGEVAMDYDKVDANLEFYTSCREI